MSQRSPNWEAPGPTITCPTCQGEGELTVSSDLQAIEKRHIAQLLARVAEEYGILLGDMVGQCRTPVLSAARYQAAYEMRTIYPEITLAEIGRIIGGRDHTTVIHGLKRHAAVNYALTRESTKVNHV